MKNLCVLIFDRKSCYLEQKLQKATDVAIRNANEIKTGTFMNKITME